MPCFEMKQKVYHSPSCWHNEGIKHKKPKKWLRKRVDVSRLLQCPIEIQQYVVDFITDKRILSRLCRASSHLRNIALSSLYRDIIVPVGTKHSHKYYTSLANNSALKYTRKLEFIVYEFLAPGFIAADHGAFHILNSLVKNTLRTFCWHPVPTCNNAPSNRIHPQVCRELLTELFFHQRNLKHIRLPMAPGNTGIFDLPSASVWLPRVRIVDMLDMRIKHLQLPIDGSSYAWGLDMVERVSTLAIESLDLVVDCDERTISWSSSRIMLERLYMILKMFEIRGHLGKVTALRFRKVTFDTNIYHRLWKWADQLLNLTRLDLMECGETGELLRAMVRRNATRLKSFKFHGGTGFIELCMFLESFKGLEELVLTLSGENFPAPECITPHSRTLRLLSLTSRDSRLTTPLRSIYGPKYLFRICSSCRELEHLSVSMIPFRIWNSHEAVALFRALLEEYLIAMLAARKLISFGIGTSVIRTNGIYLISKKEHSQYIAEKVFDGFPGFLCNLKFFHFGLWDPSYHGRTQFLEQRMLTYSGIWRKEKHRPMPPKGVHRLLSLAKTSKSKTEESTKSDTIAVRVSKAELLEELTSASSRKYEYLRELPLVSVGLYAPDTYKTWD